MKLDFKILNRNKLPSNFYIRKKTRKKIIIAAIVLILAISGSAGFYFFATSDFFIDNTGLNIFHREYTMEELILKHPYISETTYDATGNVPLDVYDYPFDPEEKRTGIAKGEDGYVDFGYVNNLEFAADYSDFDTKYEEMKTIVDDWVNLMWATGYREVSDDTDTYISSVYEALGGEYSVFNNAYTKDIVGAWVPYLIYSKYQSEVDVKSDKSLLFQADTSKATLRTVVTFNVYSGSGEVPGDKILGEQVLEIEDGASYIMDFELRYDTLTQKTYICGVNIVVRLS